MPVDEKKDSLRSVLEKKSTEELEELLALDFSEQEDDEPDVEYMMTILEVIQEREGNTEEKQAETDAAWREFQDYLKEYRKMQSETGTSEEPSHDHLCKAEQRQAPRKRPLILRYCAVAAAAIVLLCGTASAFQWDIFQALAAWTQETFSFLTGKENKEVPAHEAFEYLAVAVAQRTDIPAVPKWAPEGTVQAGNLSVAERSNKVKIQATFMAGESEFTICITVYSTVSESHTATYQKDDETVQILETGGVTHYIMDNNGNISVMWSNGCVEGYIQGDLSLDNLQRMIDSIYEE